MPGLSRGEFVGVMDPARTFTTPHFNGLGRCINTKVFTCNKVLNCMSTFFFFVERKSTYRSAKESEKKIKRFTVTPARTRLISDTKDQNVFVS